MALTRFRDRWDRTSAVATAGAIFEKAGVCRDRSLDCFALVYLVGGHGFYRDDLVGEVPVRTGDLLILRPDMVQDYGPDLDGEWSERFLVFHGPAFDALLADGLIDPRRPVWHIGRDPAIEAVFVDIAQRLTAADPDHAWCVARVHLLLIEAARHGEDESATFVAQATAALGADLAGQRRLADVAQTLDLSEQVFRKRFAELVGMPPARWRQRRRLELARQRLATSNATLAEIADELGWCDQFFFARQFKQATGQTPGAFRSAFRGGRSR